MEILGMTSSPDVVAQFSRMWEKLARAQRPLRYQNLVVLPDGTRAAIDEWMVDGAPAFQFVAVTGDDVQFGVMYRNEVSGGRIGADLVLSVPGLLGQRGMRVLEMGDALTLIPRCVREYLATAGLKMFAASAGIADGGSAVVSLTPEEASAIASALRRRLDATWNACSLAIAS